MDTTTETRHPEATVTLTPEQVAGLADRARTGGTARPDRVPLPHANRAASASATATETCGLTPCETCPTARAACCRAASKVGRAVLLSVGVVSVATGAVGVVVPGLPTTIFLIIAMWCFCRSCPPLERWVVRQPLFRPYAAFIDGKTPMPPRAVKVSLGSIWIASLASIALITMTGEGAGPWWVAGTIALAAVGGTVSVLLVARKSRRTVAVA